MSPKQVGNFAAVLSATLASPTREAYLYKAKLPLCSTNKHCAMKTSRREDKQPHSFLDSGICCSCVVSFLKFPYIMCIHEFWGTKDVCNSDLPPCMAPVIQFLVFLWQIQIWIGHYLDADY